MLDKFIGSLIGGAAGDALGYAILGIESCVGRWIGAWQFGALRW